MSRAAPKDEAQGGNDRVEERASPEIDEYRRAVEALVARCVQRVREYPLCEETEPLWGARRDD